MAIGLVWDLVATDHATPAFSRLAGVVDKAAASSQRMSSVQLEAEKISNRVKIAELQVAAATDRHANVATSATASISRLASAEIGLIRANEGLAEAQAASAAATRESAIAARESAVASSGGIAGIVRSAGQLGLLVGGFELVKKAIDITKQANEFHRSMVQTQTTADVTATEVDKASTALLKMAGPVAAAPAELATAWYHAKSVGLGYAESLKATRIAAEGARIGHADLEQTMNALTSAVASGIPGVQNMGSAMGKLLTIVGSGDMSLKDLNSALGSGVLTVVKGYGLSLTDVGAALATFGDNNIRGANAATMLRLSVQAMAVPAKAGTQLLGELGLTSEGSAAALAKVHLQTGTLARDMQTGGLNKAVLDLKSHLDKAGISGVQVGQTLTEMFGKKAGPGIAVLIGQVDRLESKYSILNRAGASFGEKWRATTQTASFALASLQHGAEAAGIEFTAKLGPAIAGGAHLLAVVLPAAVRAAETASTPFVAAFKGAADVLGPVAHWVGDLASDLAPLAPVLGGVGGAALAMFAAFKGYQLVRAAMLAIVDGAQLLAGRFVSAGLAAQGYAQDVGVALTGSGRTAAVVAAEQAAAFAGTSAAAAQNAAAISTAAADAAEAQLALARGIGVASATQIAAYEATSVAARAQASVAAGTAASSVAAADAASAGIASAGEAASVGWAGLAGPLGLAAVGVLSLVTMFHHSNTASKEAANAAKAYTDALSSGGKSSLTDTIVNQLKTNDVPARISKLNGQLKSLGSTSTVSGKEFLTAISSGGKPLDSLRDKLKATIKAGTVTSGARGPLQGLYDHNGVTAAKKLLSDLNTQYSALSKTTAKDLLDTKTFAGAAGAIQKTTVSTQLGTQAAQQYAQMAGLVVDKNGVVAQSQSVVNAAVDAVSSAYTTATATGSEFLASLQSFSTSAGTAADRASLIQSILKANAGDALSYAATMNTAATATKQLGTDISQAASQVGKGGESTKAFLHSIVDLSDGSIRYSKSAAAPLISNLQSIQTAALNAASGTYQHLLATQGAGRASSAAITQYRGVEDSLVGQLHKLGLTKTAAQKLTDQYLGVPDHVKTLIEQAGANPIVTVLNKIGTQLAYLTGHPWDVPLNVTANYDAGAQRALNAANGNNKRAAGRATGGIIRGPGGPREDRAGIYALSNGEAVIPTRGVEKHRGLVDFLIAEGRGRAAGGVIGTTSATTVYHVGKGWGFQGQYYGGKTGHKDALSARSDYINGQRAAALYHSPESRATVRTDTTAYRSSIASGDVDATRSAYATMYADAKAAGASRAALARLSASEKTIIADLQRRATITDQVSKATDHLTDLQGKAADLKSSVSGAVTGSFDITTAGQPFSDRAATADGILAQLTAKADKAAAFSTLLQTLGKEGLNQTLLQQLAEAGPAAYDQAKALAGTTPAKLAAINSQYSRLTTAGNTAGSYVSGLVFGSQIDVAEALLNGYDPKKNPKMGKAVTALATSLYGAGKVSGVGLTHGLLGQKAAAGSAAATLGQTVERELRRSLGIHSPSRVTRDLGRNTGLGYALGLEDSVARVSQASGVVGGAGVPSPAPTGSGGGSYQDNRQYHFEIHEVDNGMETHHKVMRRLALVGP